MAGPHIRIPQTIPGPIRRVMKQLDERTKEMVPFGGEPFADGAIPTELPNDQPYMIIFGKIRGDEDSGSGSGGSGSGHINDFTGAGFYDPEGYLAYSFDQVFNESPWKGTIIPGGISTHFNDDETDGKDFAYPLPPYPEFNAGDVVTLIRCGKHWSIIGGAGTAGSGSGGEEWDITCNQDGTGATARKV